MGSELSKPTEACDKYKKGQVVVLGKTAALLGMPDNDRNTEYLVVSVEQTEGKKSKLHLLQLHCGAQHIVVLSDDCQVYTYGQGANGQLGLGDVESAVENMKNVARLNHVNVVQISSGNKHVVALTDKGTVYTFGCGQDRQLGYHEFQSFTPKPIKEMNEKVIQIAAGAMHTVLLGESGTVYTLGRGKEGQLGHEQLEQSSQPKPRSVKSLSGIDVVKINAGYGHTAALTRDGKIYIFGRNMEGQLGIGGQNTEPKFTAVLVESLSDVNIVDISCGYFHTLACTDAGEVYSWGWGGEGRLGHGNVDHQRAPRIIQYLCDQKIRVVQLATGFAHSVVLDNKGVVYGFGNNNYGQLGRTKKEFILLPEAIDDLPQDIYSVSCGMDSTVVLYGKKPIVFSDLQQMVDDQTCADLNCFVKDGLTECHQLSIHKFLLSARLQL